MQAVMMIINYMKATPRKRIMFTKNGDFLKVEGYIY